jgi:hypothetical protein
MRHTDRRRREARFQFGLTIAPAFTAFFDHLTEIVIANRDAIVEFGQILGSLLKPWKELPSS